MSRKRFWCFVRHDDKYDLLSVDAITVQIKIRQRWTQRKTLLSRKHNVDNARGDVNKDFYGRKLEPDGLWKNRTGAIYKIPAGDFIYHLGRSDAPLQQYTPGPPLVPGVWFQYDIVVAGNHYEVTLTNTQSGVSQLTTIFDNPDAARGVGQLNGQPAGFICIQSYPSSPFAFRDIWIQ